ncbi:DUF4402 domain-containing protein [Allopontixanthobacter sp.]|uniref:DUF4402 domain-containing protein n=1 Tax=Allopontixanthobacter sp. TaxID=2906452 RepID=UPI002ABB3B02|nr:DUF4402 domain-containing protein [Allopontixanthobacter sp.]MDZ4306683.1 DUF4402 domain-containing protein [Allopontixanthobacter sp.]
MIRLIALLASAAMLMLLPAAPAAAQGQCNFCETNPPPKGGGGGRPGNGSPPEIVLTIESEINFGRLVMVGDGVGRVLIDIQTGAKTIIGNLDDLGGLAVQGRATIRGVPRQPVRVEFPTLVTMRDPAGGEAELRDFVTDLGQLPRLDSTGVLEFRFTGTLYTDLAVALGGNLRGRVPIQVSYD